METPHRWRRVISTGGATASEEGAADLARAEALIAEAREQSRNGRFSLSWRASADAAVIARRRADGRLMARAATALVGPQIADFGVTASRQALCVEALAMLGDDDGDLRELVTAQLGALSSPWSAPVGLDRRLEADEAQRRFVALQAEHARAMGPDGPDERIDIAARIIELGTASADDEMTAWGRLWRLDALLELGLRLEFDAELLEFTAVVARHPAPVWLWRLAGVKASLALLEDRVADVPGLLAESLRLGDAAGVDEAVWLALVIRSAYARRTADGLDQVEAEVRQALAGAPFFAQGWRAGLLISLGRSDEANSIWRAIAPRIDEMPRATAEWLVAMSGYAESAIMADDLEGAARVRQALEPYAGRHVSGSAMTPYGGPVSLVVGELSAFLGDRAAARSSLHDAERRAEAMNAPRYAARAREGLALIARHDGPLSPRELEVARLVATGESNRAIAARMHLSERTVEQHVSSALRKLGLSGRAGLAAWIVGSSRSGSG